MTNLGFLSIMISEYFWCLPTDCRSVMVKIRNAIPVTGAPQQFLIGPEGRSNTAGILNEDNRQQRILL
jgi:hypothetical protein